jgi:ABC-2 type transport system ATP-binding protein
VNQSIGDAVVVRGLVKVYSGGLRALDGIDLTVKEGEVFGLIGPNGAGKSTTIRILATLLRPTEGSVSMLGRDVVEEEIAVRGYISYLPEDAGVYENLTGREYLGFMARFYSDDPGGIVERGMRMADLRERIDSRAKEYSKGMKRRLLIARTLMTSPRIAIMDEPTAGLDVMHGHYVRREVKRAIQETRSTAIISSHNLLEVEFLCDRVALINKGRIIEQGTPAELKARHGAANLEEVFLGVVGNA